MFEKQSVGSKFTSIKMGKRYPKVIVKSYFPIEK